MRALRVLAVLAALAVLAGGAGCFNLNVDVGKPSGSSGGQAMSAEEPGAGAPEGGGAGAPAGAGNASWTDIVRQYAGGTFLGAEHGVLFFGFDTLAYPNAPVELAAKAVSDGSLKGIEGATVEFAQGGTVLGRAVTGADGIARLKWTAPNSGDYLLTARAVGAPEGRRQEMLQIAPVELLVAARPATTPFAVIDLDRTIVGSSFSRVLLDGGAPMADSVAVTKRIAERYGIIYLTHRPDMLTRRSKAFLKSNGYPAGPLLVADLRDVFDSGAFKTAKLSEVRKAYPRVAVGIGDKPSDAQAYVDNGLTAYLIPRYKDKPDDLREMAGELRKLRGQGRLNVVADWRQIEEGIFRRRSFPPDAFARWLEQRASRLEAERDRDEDD